jgi:hypothetical protein
MAMKMNPISDREFKVIRVIRWIFIIPTMYATAFMTGLMFIPMRRPGKVLAILLSALAGVGLAPRNRVWVAVFAFFYGNYLYATNINYIYHENYSELLVGYGAAIVKQAKLFSIPTVLTLIAAVQMDRKTKSIEQERTQLKKSPQS